MTIEYSVGSDHVATVRIVDPATRNALSDVSGVELRDAILRAQSEARALVLCGTEKAFCSGANLASGDALAGLSSPDFDAGRSLDDVFNPLMRTLRDLGMPWIAAVHGAAAGVGASIALSADLIVAGESAYFLQAFRKIGLVPDGGSTYLLTRAVGRVRAMEMMLLGEKIPALRALEWGLINRVVPDAQVEETAFAFARELAAGPTKALAAIRRVAWIATDTDFETALTSERDAQRIAARNPNFREGVQAFLEKRAPRFTSD